MPECNQFERDLLDALNGHPDKNLAECRIAMILARVPEDLVQAAIAARCAAIRASQMEKKAWDALEKMGVPGKWGMTKGFEAFYDRIEAAAKERAGV